MTAISLIALFVRVLFQLAMVGDLTLIIPKRKNIKHANKQPVSGTYIKHLSIILLKTDEIVLKLAAKEVTYLP